MRDILVVLAICVAAIAVGLGFYLYGPGEMRETPAVSETVGTPITPEPLPVETTVRVTVLDAGTNAGGTSSRKNAAAYDTEGLKKIWQFAHGTDGTPLPSVDFSKQAVIGVFAGTRPSGGYSIEVSSVIDSKDTRTVTITLTKPGPGCIVSQALTSPYQVVAVPVSLLPLTKVERTVETACR